MADDKKGAPESEKKKGKGGLRWILLIILLGALGGGGYFAYQKFVLAPKADDAAHSTAAPDALEDKSGKKDAKDVRGVSVPMPTFLVNLNDPLGRRYLKLGMDVEVVDKAAADQLSKTDLARAKDAVILLLSSKTFQDVNTVENKIVMRNEIVERLNQVIGAGKVLKVYFTEIIVQ